MFRDRIRNKPQDFGNNSRLDQHLAEVRAIARNVRQRPHGLLYHIWYGRSQQVEEGGAGARADYALRLCCIPFNIKVKLVLNTAF